MAKASSMVEDSSVRRSCFGGAVAPAPDPDPDPDPAPAPAPAPAASRAGGTGSGDSMVMPPSPCVSESTVCVLGVAADLAALGVSAGTVPPKTTPPVLLYAWSCSGDAARLPSTDCAALEGADHTTCLLPTRVAWCSGLWAARSACSLLDSASAAASAAFASASACSHPHQ